MSTFTVKQGDYGVVQAQLQNADGSIPDLKNATSVRIRVVDRSVYPHVLIKDDLATVVGSTVNGIVQYKLVPTYTVIPGVFYIEFKAYWVDGTTSTYPNGDDIVLDIEESLEINWGVQSVACRFVLTTPTPPYPPPPFPLAP